ncbi:UDP-N-acetylglucosamine 2-epimerase (hydrolyzing) [Polaribacter pectinis]|uniref:UDP-N-acetylglucosamine 2-epimerase (Hydrolyzing) n=1 Tax=Polaribacter pectinis TaxID=2738844 RepID=A0A7G9LAX1_9FLAO|nr:UDP-N-acetylglucosamine 2-epimerase [Polaribacter pectinis]QNM85770.1 UDP-N-acetylglucosamine 2-epimerase (hydrolyzing) [Polaribacter pectinis]
MQTKRKICVVVTARPSYSRVKTVLASIIKHKDLELQLVVAGSALIKRYGNAIKVMEDDGFKIDAKVYNVLEVENETAMAKTTSMAIMELSNVFYNLKPDAVLTIADRYETLGTSIAASYQNIPLIHLQGGEITGNIDEKVRHANTKLADIHLVSSEKAEERVIKMGENPKFVFNTGCPSLDLASKIEINTKLDFDPIARYGGVGSDLDISKGYLIVMQHPETNEYKNARKHISETLDVIRELKIPTLWFWPNVDAGSDGTSSGIRHYREEYDLNHVHFFKNMVPKDFLMLLNNSICLIGNSSAGIRECAFLGVKAVNIGKRQDGRDRGKNVIDVDYKKEEIKEAVLKFVNSERPGKDYLYGKGNSGEIIADILGRIDLPYSKILQY